jgi:asparagine synthase (glutamine-hydrolysing)
MFGGYDIARAAYYSTYYEQYCPAWLKSTVESMVFSRPDWGKHNSGLHKFKTLLVHASRDSAIRHSYSMAFSQAQKDPIYTAAFKTSLNGHAARHIYDEYWSELMSLNLIDRHLSSTIRSRLPDDYLVKVDVASMKCALELRCPFLDTELSQLAGSIDPRLKVKNGTQKYLLKKLAERYLPMDVIYRKKRGFELPLAHWLRTDFSKLVAAILGEGTLVRTGILDKKGVTELLSEHVNGQANHTHRIWALFWLELWHRMFVERTLKPTDSLN